MYARLAQLVEHPLDVGRVTGSNPVSRTHSMITLAIETSCDETAVCLLETRVAALGTEYRILGNLVLSQVALHAQYGGVFPAMAKREHALHLIPLIEKILKDANVEFSNVDNSTEAITGILKEKESELLAQLLKSPLFSKKPKIDRIAVTKGPGLEPALWVGVNCARALNAIWGTPVVAVNHMEGHVLGSLLPSSKKGEMFHLLHPMTFPALAVLISGGHTELALVKKIGDYEIIGKTKDDAVGEAFDKVARMLGLPYPGGPEISALAEKVATGPNTDASSATKISLPRPMIRSNDLNFSFSGLKTSVLYLIRELGGIEKIDDKTRAEIAKEFQEAVSEVLATKTAKAIDAHDINALIVGGGVIANTRIKKAFEALSEQYDIPLLLPPPGVSGDNALMIAIAGSLSGTEVVNIGELTASGNMVL